MDAQTATITRPMRGPVWQHSEAWRDGRHTVPEITTTREHDGASLCAACGAVVDMTPAWSAYYDDVIARERAAWHADLRALGATVGPETTYGACSAYCAHP